MNELSATKAVVGNSAVSNQLELTDDAFFLAVRLEARLKPYFEALGDRIEVALKRELGQQCTVSERGLAWQRPPTAGTMVSQGDQAHHDQDLHHQPSKATAGGTPKKRLWNVVGDVVLDDDLGWVRTPSTADERLRRRRHRHRHRHHRQGQPALEEPPKGPRSSPLEYTSLKEHLHVRTFRSADFARRYASMSTPDGLLTEQHQNCCDRLVENPNFVKATTCLVVLNCLVLALETDYAARHWDHPKYWIFRYLASFMCILFTLEVVIRIVSKGMYAYFTDAKSWRLNLFEVLVTAVQWGDVISMLSATYGRDVPFHHELFILRHARIFSIFRFLRVIRSVHYLRVMVQTISGSINSFMTLSLLLILSTFLFGAILTSIVANHIAANPEDVVAREELQEFFGSLTKTMLSLYEVAAEGAHWDKMLVPLEQHCSPWLRFAFVSYSTFTLLGLMNIFSGLFLETAMRIATDEKKNIVVEHMAAIFRHHDLDKTGMISDCEFETLLEEDDNLQFLMSTMEIRPEHAMQLFALVDEDSSGEVELNEFLIGFERLQGSAKAIELACFRLEWHLFTEKMDHLFHHVFPGGLEMRSHREGRKWGTGTPRVRAHRAH